MDSYEMFSDNNSSFFQQLFPAGMLSFSIKNNSHVSSHIQEGRRMKQFNKLKPKDHIP